MLSLESLHEPSSLRDLTEPAIDAGIVRKGMTPIWFQFTWFLAYGDGMGT